MAPERNENEGENADNGVLATTDGTETTGIGIVEGATAQVEVTLPTAFDEEDDFDDDVVRGEDVTLVQLEQLPDRVPDDSTGIVGSHDHLAGARDCLLRHREHLGRRLVLGRVLQQGDCAVQLGTVVVGGPPTVQVGAGPHQGKDLVSEGHGHIMPGGLLNDGAADHQ